MSNTHMFKPAIDLLVEAHHNNAPLLAPATYAEAFSLYSEAKKEFSLHEDQQRLAKKLADVERIFQKSIILAKQASKLYASLLHIRDLSQRAGLHISETELWLFAEDELFQALRYLEEGEFLDGEIKAIDAEIAYWQILTNSQQAPSVSSLP